VYGVGDYNFTWFPSCVYGVGDYNFTWFPSCVYGVGDYNFTWFPSCVYGVGDYNFTWFPSCVYGVGDYNFTWFPSCVYGVGDYNFTWFLNKIILFYYRPLKRIELLSNREWAYTETIQAAIKIKIYWTITYFSCLFQNIQFYIKIKLIIFAHRYINLNWV